MDATITGPRSLDPDPSRAVIWRPVAWLLCAALYGWTAALEWRAGEKLRITPNITTTIYDRNEEGFKPDTDLHLRLTFFLNFE